MSKKAAEDEQNTKAEEQGDVAAPNTSPDEGKKNQDDPPKDETGEENNPEKAEDRSKDAADDPEKGSDADKDEREDNGDGSEDPKDAGDSDGAGAAEDEKTQRDPREILLSLPGVGPVLADRMMEGGLNSEERIKEASEEDFLKIVGIGPSHARELVTAAGNLDRATDISSNDNDEQKADGLKDDKGIMDKTVGVMGGLFNKVKGFLMPKPKSPETQKSPDLPKTDDDPGTGNTDDAKSSQEVSKEDGNGTPDPDMKTPGNGKQDHGSEGPGGVSVTIAEEDEDGPSLPDISISVPYHIPGLDDGSIKLLVDSGYATLEEVKEASREDLELIAGLNRDTVQKILDSS